MLVGLGGVGRGNASEMTVEWNSLGSPYLPGTLLSPSGKAAAMEGGPGLDLAILIDARMGMGEVAGSSSGDSTLMDFAKEAAVAIVEALPTASTSVEVIAFDWDHSKPGRSRELAPTVLLPLTPLSIDKDGVLAAINGVSPGTLGGDSFAWFSPVVETAFYDLLGGEGHTAGHSREVALVGTGSTTGTGISNGGIWWEHFDQRYVVGLPGYAPRNVDSLIGGDDYRLGTADDEGLFAKAGDVSPFFASFDLTAGEPVALDRIEVELPDGTVEWVGFDLFGNFSPMPWEVELGWQEWKATAWAMDGATASDMVGTYGWVPTTPEPAAEGGSTARLLLGALLPLLLLMRRGSP